MAKSIVHCDVCGREIHGKAIKVGGTWIVDTDECADIIEEAGSMVKARDLYRDRHHGIKKASDWATPLPSKSEGAHIADAWDDLLKDTTRKESKSYWKKPPDPPGKYHAYTEKWP